jgi:hypothetical protein
MAKRPDASPRIHCQQHRGDWHQQRRAASLGQVGLDWQVGGFAADAPTASTAAMGGASQVGQLVQAMASFGTAGAADGVNAAALGADASQQPLLTTPQHV